MTEPKIRNGNWISRLIQDHGPVAAMLVVACGALYLCVVVPFQAQQGLLTESNKILLDNTIKQSERVSAGIEAMNATQKQQLNVLETLNELSEDRNTQIARQLQGASATLESLSAFSKRVTEEHGRADQKLDIIIEAVKPQP